MHFFVAFADLVVGYILAAFSPTADSQTSVILMEVIVLTCALLVIEYYLSRFCARKIYAQDAVIPFEKHGRSALFLPKQQTF